MRTLRSRRIVSPDGIVDGTISFSDGRIVAIVAGATDGEDVGDAAILPGLVDSHAHLNEPGRTDWEGFDTATRAAAAGGVTTIVDMPLNCIPVTTSLEALQVKQRAVADHAHIDYAFWGGIVPGNAHELDRMIAAGIRGFKAFTCFSGIDDFPASDEATIRRALEVIAQRVPLLVHAELESDAPAWNDPRSYASYLASRPDKFETDAIAMIIRLAAELHAPVHIVHLSTADALASVEHAKRRGVPITIETCPHYLTLAAEDVPDGHTEWKCAPPIRANENRERLWAGLLRGAIDLVVSDHSPCTPNLKLRDKGDFEHAWGGIASLQLAFPLVWTEAHRRGATLSDMARWMSAHPANLAGLPRKGELAPGMDADLVILEPEESFTVTPELIQFRHKVTPYMGRTITGRVRETVLRGTTIYKDGTFPHLATGRLVPTSET